jgi:DNA-3-methyladenine glycosylase
MPYNDLAPLPRDFYARPTLLVARDVLGKTLVHRSAEGLTAGIIVEAEAYVAAIDPAAHGYRGLTARVRSMFGLPGHAYVYRSHGIHFCLNLVTEREGEAAAVLLRALQPTEGIALMQARRGEQVADRDLCRGPGRLCQALGVTLAHDGADLVTPGPGCLWVAQTPRFPLETPIATSPRIGISRAADWPWRFYFPGNPYVSARPA